jgi:hypothetical protein
VRGRVACLVPALFLIALVVGPAPAHAAPTRAEYIAQVDPICQNFVVPERSALATYRHNYKLWLRAAVKGTLKSFLRQNRRLARSLFSFDRVHSALTEQVAAVTPPDADVALIATWLNARRQADALSDAAARALLRFKARKFFTLIGRADRVEANGTRALSGYGFQVCGVSA